MHGVSRFLYPIRKRGYRLFRLYPPDEFLFGQAFLFQRLTDEGYLDENTRELPFSGNQYRFFPLFDYV